MTGDLANSVGAELEGAAHGEAGEAFALARRLRTPVWVYDIDAARIVLANAAACDFWNARTEADLRARDLSKDMSPAVRDRLQQYKSDFQAGDPSFREMWTVYPDGQPKHVLIWFRHYPLPGGRIGMQCEALQRDDLPTDSLRSVEALLHADIMVLLFSLGGKPLFLNAAARETFGHRFENFRDLFIDEADHTLMMFELDRLQQYREIARVATAHGPRWHELSAKLSKDALTGDPAILVTTNDVSALKDARDHARFLAERDQLTGAFNRFFLHRYFERLSTMPGTSSGVLYFDLDRFKGINDNFGHEAGDTVLKAVVDRCHQALGDDGVLTRLGGDEFVVVFPELDNVDDLSRRTEALQRAVSQPVQHGDTSLAVSISVGAAHYNPRRQSYHDVQREADLALYEAKKAGRNRAVIFGAELRQRFERRRDFESDLRSAIAERRLSYHFQPRVDLSTQDVVSAEALLRWEHPEHGMLAPEDFLSIIEDAGLTQELGRLTIEMAVTQAKAWSDGGLSISLAVNLHARLFQSERFFDFLTETSKHPDFIADRIELEMSEVALTGDIERISARLRAIRSLGFHVVMDDFGAGHSNLASLPDLPLKGVKIDRSYLASLPGSAPMIEMIIKLADELGVVAMAEGIETDDHVRWLKARSCEQGQGFLLSPPVPLEELPDVVRELRARKAS